MVAFAHAGQARSQFRQQLCTRRLWMTRWQIAESGKHIKRSPIDTQLLTKDAFRQMAPLWHTRTPTALMRQQHVWCSSCVQATMRNALPTFVGLCPEPLSGRPWKKCGCDCLQPHRKWNPGAPQDVGQTIEVTNVGPELLSGLWHFPLGENANNR